MNSDFFCQVFRKYGWNDQAPLDIVSGKYNRRIIQDCLFVSHAKKRERLLKRLCRHRVAGELFGISQFSPVALFCQQKHFYSSSFFLLA
jgi:hypothetical protein